MSTGFFGDIAKIKYEGPESSNPLAFRHYNKDEVVLGKRMEDHLRFAVAYWHTFVWPGGDPFGGQTFERPWFKDSMDAAKLKADVAFEFFDLLGVPFYCFHDADVRPEGKSFVENTKNLNEIVDHFERSRPRPASTCSGARRTSSPTGATCRVRRPIRIRMSSLSRPQR